jgi:hypothetical protein
LETARHRLRIERPVFAWNHDYVMCNGADGLARLLSARLLTAGGGPAQHTI